jgi:hypothetical protein
MTLRIDDHAERLLAATVAGGNTSHGAENNLRKIRLMVEADPNNTYGMEDLLRDVTFEEAYDAVSRQLGNPPTARRRRAGGASTRPAPPRNS